MDIPGRFLISISRFFLLGLIVSSAQAVTVEVQTANPLNTVNSNQPVALDLLFTVTPDSPTVFDPNLVLAEYGSGGHVWLFDKNDNEIDIDWCGIWRFCSRASGLELFTISTPTHHYPGVIVSQGETIQFTYHYLSLNLANLSDGDYVRVLNGLEFDYIGEYVNTSYPYQTYPNARDWYVTASIVPLPAGIYLFLSGIVGLMYLSKRK